MQGLQRRKKKKNLIKHPEKAGCLSERPVEDRRDLESPREKKKKNINWDSGTFDFLIR